MRTFLILEYTPQRGPYDGTLYGVDSSIENRPNGDFRYQESP